MLASKILSATDFSDHANKLVQCLGEFQSLGIRNVLLVHVLKKGAKDKDFQKARDNLALIKDKIDKTGMETETRVLTGKPEEEITGLAEEENCSAIVMASPGVNVLKHFFLGGTTYNILRKSRVPVFIEKHENLGDGVIKPVCNIRFSRILIPIDCTVCSDSLVQAVLGLNKELESVTMVSAIEKNFSLEKLKKREEEVAQELNEFKKSLLRSGKIAEVNVVIDEGAASELILSSAEEHDSTMIMMPTRGVDSMEGLKLGSTADIIARKSSLPLFFLPCDPINNQNFLFSCEIKGE